MESVASGDNTSRRSVLRMLVGVPVGIAASEVLVSTSEPVQDEAHDLTGLDVGNAYMQEQIRADCGPQPSHLCIEERFDTPGAQRTWVGTSPLLEEFDFRAAPSFARDVITDPDSDAGAAFRNTLVGRSRVPLTRGEFLTGAITSLIFGFTHDVTLHHGIEARVLPVEQTIGGGVLWSLQRKFGFFSNYAAHSWFNFQWLRNPR